MTSAVTSGARSVSTSTSSRCWAQIRTVSTRTGRPVLVLDRTWLLPSGRRYGTTPALRTSARRVREPVRHGDRQRHQLLGLAAGEAEHHALVAGAQRDRGRRANGLAVLERVVDAPGDVRRLLLDRGHHPAGLAVEAELGVRVADVDDRVAHDRRDVHVGLGR